jgi:hypothetical protein
VSTSSEGALPPAAAAEVLSAVLPLLVLLVSGVLRVRESYSQGPGVPSASERTLLCHAEGNPQGTRPHPPAAVA